jgi:hypothetical protein
MLDVRVLATKTNAGILRKDVVVLKMSVSMRFQLWFLVVPACVIQIVSAKVIVNVVRVKLVFVMTKLTSF